MSDLQEDVDLLRFELRLSDGFVRHAFERIAAALNSVEGIATQSNTQAGVMEALEYARMVIDTLSEKAVGKGDRVYCSSVLKPGNSIDAAIDKARGVTK